MLFIPKFIIQTESRDITQALNNRVSKVEINEYASTQSDELILELDDHDKKRIQIPEMGLKIKVQLGYEEKTQEKDQIVTNEFMGPEREFEVAEFNFSGARDSLTIYATNLKFNQSFKSPKQQSWPSTSDQPLLLETVVNTIAQEHGLQARLNDDLGQLQLSQIDQSESDMQLLYRLASLCDATVKIANGYLIFKQRSDGNNVSGQALEVTTIPRKELVNWNMLSSNRPNFQSCTAWYHDWQSAQRHSVSAGSGEPSFNLSHTFANEDMANLAAMARLNDFKRTQYTIKASCFGKAELSPGGVVEISNVRNKSNQEKVADAITVDGRWCLTKVKHIVDSNGFFSQFEGEKTVEQQ